MFEKEAEEFKKQIQQDYLDLGKNGAYPPLWERIGELWKNGAEFGYNRVNEWHFVKDELPPVKKEYNGRSELVLVLSKEKEMQYAQYVEKEKTWARGICEINFEPYAWKEIVLPKEMKENG